MAFGSSMGTIRFQGGEMCEVGILRLIHMLFH